MARSYPCSGETVILRLPLLSYTSPCTLVVFISSLVYLFSLPLVVVVVVVVIEEEVV